MKKQSNFISNINLIIPSIMFISAVALAVSILSVNYTERKYFITQNMNTTTNLLKESFKQNLIDSNNENINIILNTIMENTNIISAELFMKENGVFILTAGKFRNKDNKIEDLLIPDSISFTDKKYEVAVDDIGKIVIKTNKFNIQIFSKIFIPFCILIISNLLIYFFAYYRFIKPSIKINNFINEKLPKKLCLIDYPTENKIHKQLLDNINGLISRLLNDEKNFQLILKQLEETSVENQKISNDFNDAANIEAAAIEQISATLTQSASALKNISTSTKNSSKKLSDGASKANTSYSLIDNIIEAIDEISDQSKKIQSSLALIYDITEETEMLAMNASIEAAKAGEFGKGFSVVANEIRKLAEKSQATANEIDKKIDHNNEIVGKAQKFIIDSQNTLKEIIATTIASDQILSEVTVAISESYAGQNEIIKSVNQINDSINKMLTITKTLQNNASGLISLSDTIKNLICTSSDTPVKNA